jgi:hypothetical protein
MINIKKLYKLNQQDLNYIELADWVLDPPKWSDKTKAIVKEFIAITGTKRLSLKNDKYIIKDLYNKELEDLQNLYQLTKKHGDAFEVLKMQLYIVDLLGGSIYHGSKKLFHNPISNY